MITLVCGLGRCGTSLTMKMLGAGGMPLFEDKAGSHEHSRMVTLPANQLWVQYADGHALKVNDPHVYTPPSNLEYSAIWLTRNPTHQARSMMKLNTALGKTELGSRTSYRKKVRWIKRSEPKCASLLKKLSHKRYLHQTFEHLLTNPKEYANRLAALVGLPLDIPSMVACVRSRTTEVLERPIELSYGND